MIVFDLLCEHGHVFEGWFGSGDDYEDQNGRGLVSCPICATGVVGKAPMSPRVGRKGNQVPALSASAASSGGTAVPMTTESPDAPGPAQLKAMFETMAKAQARMLENSDYVGASFAEEARAMHLGEVDHRTIHGQATPEEARSLLEDGVPVMPLPFPVVPPEASN